MYYTYIIPLKNKKNYTLDNLVICSFYMKKNNRFASRMRSLFSDSPKMDLASILKRYLFDIPGRDMIYLETKIIWKFEEGCKSWTQISRTIPL